VAEFCNAWIKSKLGLRQFHVRGLVKVQTEMLWACLTYNLQQWIRIEKQAPPPLSVAKEEQERQLAVRK
jgi:DDE family transposase